MQLEVGGTRYEGFETGRLTIRLDALSREFDFGMSSEAGVGLPFTTGERARVFVDGEQQFDGWIEKVNVAGDAESHDLNIEGRDRTCDIVDSGFAALNDLSAPISLREVGEAVIAHIGSDLRFIEAQAIPKFLSVEDVAAAEPGENCFAFLEALARKRQVLLTSDEFGNVVATRAEGRPVNQAIIQRDGDPDLANNVLSYAVQYDHSGRFRTYKVLSQLNPAVGDPLEAEETEVVFQEGVQEDPGSRQGRQHVIVGETSGSSNWNKDRATWEANVRRSRSKVYSCTVDGFRGQDGKLWAINTTLPIADEFAGIDGPMLVNSVVFWLSAGGGRNTTLSFVEPDAYTVSLKEPIAVKTTIGKNLDWEADLAKINAQKAAAGGSR